MIACDFIFNDKSMISTVRIHLKLSLFLIILLKREIPLNHLLYIFIWNSSKSIKLNFGINFKNKILISNFKIIYFIYLILKVYKDIQYFVSYIVRLKYVGSIRILFPL